MENIYVIVILHKKRGKKKSNKYFWNKEQTEVSTKILSPWHILIMYRMYTEQDWGHKQSGQYQYNEPFLDKETRTQRCLYVETDNEKMSIILNEWWQTWMQKARPSMLLASQCFCEAYHAQKNVPGIAAIIWDLVNSISKAV